MVRPLLTADSVRLFLAIVCLLGATGCDEKSPVGPTISLNQQFTLAPAQVAVVRTTSMRLQFVAVTSDSRCPADAICVRAGEAIVRVRVFDSGNSGDYELQTGDSRRASVTHRDVRVGLLQVQPYPFSNRRIEPPDYRATLVVER